MNYNISNIQSETVVHAMDETSSTPTTISFAGINLDPAPFVSINIEKYNAGDYTIGGIMNVTLNGVFHKNNFHDSAENLKAKITNLADNHKCINNIKIECGSGNPIITSGVGWIRNYSFPEGDQKSWFNIIPYTIELVVLQSDNNRLIKPDTKLDSKYSLANNYIKSLRENISYSIDDKVFQTFSPSGGSISADHIFSNEHIVVKYSLDVQGLGMCNCSGSNNKFGLGAAYEVIKHRNTNIQTLTEQSLFVCPTGQIFPSGKYNTAKRYNHTRDIQVNELEGSISINGQYIIRPTGVAGNILFTMDSNTDANIESGEKNITINGNIKGLIENTFTDIIGQTSVPSDSNKNAIDAAEQRLYELLNNNHAYNIIDYLKDKNNLLAFNAVGSSPLGEYYNDENNSKPLGFGNDETSSENYQNYTGSDAHEFRLMSKMFKRNHTDGSIDFTLSYSNKNKYKIPNALWADINIEHELPAKRLVEHVIPGRGYPITQDLQCDTLDIYTITYNAQFEPTANIHKIIGAARQVILTYINETASALQITNWIRTGDNESIGNNGSYRRTMKFTRHSCFDASSQSSVLKYQSMDAGGSEYENVVPVEDLEDITPLETWFPDVPTEPQATNEKG